MVAERPQRLVDRAQLIGSERGEGLHAEAADHGLADVPPLDLRLDDVSDAAREDRLAEADLAVEALPAQHRSRAGVDRDVLDTHTYLPVRERLEWFLHERETVGCRLADGAVGERHAGVGRGHPVILARRGDGLRCEPCADGRDRAVRAAGSVRPGG